MIFKRYSNPFSLLDELIETNQFSDYVSFIPTKFEEDIEFKVWLHKVFDKSFNEFKKDIKLSNDAQVGYMKEEDVKTTIQKSNEILSNFIPQ